MKTKLPSLAHSSVALLVMAALHCAAPAVFAQGTAFTYQGRLNDGTNPVTGNFDMRFQIYDVATGGAVVAGPITNAPIGVTNGLFTVLLDFGPGVFTGSSNWLHIGVRTNGSAGGYTSLLPRQQLTPTPYAIYAETANAAGLTGAVPPGAVPDTSLSANVALLNATQTFTGNNSFSGNISMLNDSTSLVFPATSGANTPMMEMFSSGTVNADRMVIAHSPPFQDWGLQYQDAPDKFNFLSGGTPVLSVNLGAQSVYAIGSVGIGTVNPAQQYLSVHGGLNVDQANLNNGFINNGNTNGYGITFGSGSGEGIASKRTAGGNLFGLDFYTGFANRMSLANSGNLELNANDLWLLNGNSNYGLGYRTSVAGISPSGGDGIFLYGFDVGYLGTVNPDSVALTWDWHNNVWVYNRLTVGGEFAVVNGLGNEQAYMGGDGAGNDVQFGSLKAGLTSVAFYNATDNAYMHIYCSSISIEGGADLAEPFKITSGKDEISQGAVVVIDVQNPGHLKVSDRPYDKRVAGVVSGANGVNPGIQMQQQGVIEGGKNVALTGRVYVQADVSNGAIQPGDMLTTSSAPGYAMKVNDYGKAAGAILGKAMTGLSEGKGMVLVLVTLQ